MHRRMILAMFWCTGALVCSPAQSQQTAAGTAGQSGSVWDLGSQRQGGVYPTTIAATNECSGRRTFAVELEDQAQSFLRLEGAERIENVRRGRTEAVNVAVDLRQIAPGVYNDGRVRIRCVDCPPSCRQDVKILEVKLEVLPLEAAPAGRDPSSAPADPTVAVAGPGEAESPPSGEAQRREAARRAAGETVAAARKCVRTPRALTIQDWDWIGSLDRNRAQGRTPASSFDLNDVREELERKLQIVRAMELNIGRVIDAYGGLEKYGIECKPRSDAPQSFPEFPKDDFFFEVDLCSVSGERDFVDFLSPDADTAALDGWYRDFDAAMKNFGLDAPKQGTWCQRFDAEAQLAIARLAAAGAQFQVSMEVTTALGLNRTAAWNKFLNGMVTAVAIAISAGTAGGGAMAWMAASGAGLQSFALTEGVRAMSAGDPKAVAGAQIIGSIVSLGMGTAASLGQAGFAGALQQELLTGVGIDSALGTGQAVLEAQAKNVSLSMAVLDDAYWDATIKYLRDEVGYEERAITRMQQHRATLRNSVKQQLEVLCGLRLSLQRLYPQMEQEWEKAVALLETKRWRDDFQDKELDCFCCEYSDGAGPDRACRFTIPDF